ncbi:MAG TPA: alpha/beta hydrolase [Pseudolysinimonas sp.]|nr:alpha/beta hydrolase [Pseudolysinimonas sp.]
MTTQNTLIDVAPGHVDVIGLDTVYRRRGEGDPVLFFEGQGYSGRWIPFYEELAATFDVIVPDHPSFGETELVDPINDFNDLSVHYAAFLDALGVGPVHAVGQGFGAWVAGEFAAIYPERVRSLTLISPTGTLPDEDEKMVDPYRLDREHWLDAALGPDRDQYNFVIDSDEDGVNRVLTDYKERIGIARVAWNPRYSLRMEHRLARVTAPSQVLIPEEDKLITPSVARRYSELLSTAAPVTIVGASAPTQHLLVIQEPAQIAQKVVELASQAS